MNETRMNFFKRIYYSVAGFDKYKLFISQKTGKAVVYLLLLSLLLSIIGLIRPVIEFNKFVNEVIVGFDKAVPDFTFENGKLDVKSDTITITGEGVSTVIIDTTGKVDESILEKYDTATLILKNKMIQKNYANVQVTDFSMIQGIRFTKENLKNMLPLMKGVSVFVFLIFPFFVIAGRFISALFVSTIGIIIKTSKNMNVQFNELFIISAHSLTLPLILGTFLDFVGIPFLISTFIFYLISGIYVWGALTSIKKNDEVPMLPPIE